MVSTPKRGDDNNARDCSPLRTPNPMPLGSRSENRNNEVVTPNKNRNMFCDSQPRTPTPFKKAMAEFEKKSGPLKTLPQTPTRLEDITEIMKKEQELSESAYETDCSNNYLQVCNNLYLNKKIITLEEQLIIVLLCVVAG